MSSAYIPFVAGPAYHHKSLGQHVDLASLNSTMDFFASQPETVTILKSQYEDLLRVARQFDNLKESLLRGGVGQEDLDVLVNDAVAPIPNDENPVQMPYHETHQLSDGASSTTQKPSSKPASTSFRQNHKTNHRVYKYDPYPSGDSIEEEDDDELELEETENQGIYVDEQQEQISTANGVDDDDEQHTIEMRNLPQRCTHLDITKSIKGGALVQIYMRFTERMARVTFVDAAAAREFLARGKQIGFYIHNKKVDLSWSNHEFSLRPYIKQSIISNGATRNLIIRNANANITPALIREHLEHINNLIVINIRIDQMNRSISICTNSVHNAMFARSCMRSRAAYKGMKIDFGVDECAAPWNPRQSSTLSATAPEDRVSSALPMPKGKGSCEMQQGSKRRQISSVSNRFDLLSLGSDTDSDE